MLSICLFHSLSPSVVFFMPYLSLPKCQEQKGRKKRNYRTDYSWGLLIKQVMQILRIYGAIRLFSDGSCFAGLFTFLGGKHEKISLCGCFSRYLSKSE